MSDNNSASGHDEAHTGPIKNPKQLLLAVAYSFILPVFIIIGLVYAVTSGYKPAAGSVDPERAVAERIQKVGAVDIRNTNRALRSGEEVFKTVCSACHLTGAIGSPKFGDAVAWAPRIKTGFDALWNSAMKGKNGMPAQGGGDQADLEIARAVVYMANAGGAKFAEPQAPAASAPVPAK
jgi:cytochrome c5